MRGFICFVTCIAFATVLSLCSAFTARADDAPMLSPTELATLRADAEKGSDQARWNLGRQYDEGRSLAQHYGEAMKWFRLAADHGYPDGQNSVGRMYFSGHGVPADTAEALRWFRMAAARGLDKSQFNLGLASQYGNGVPHDDAEAVRWFRKSADQGFARAQLQLGTMIEAGLGVRADSAEALRWYQRAADQGLPAAQFRVANRYIYGAGVKKDYAAAYRWHRLAADAGYAPSQSWMGAICSRGWGVAKSDSIAGLWYRLAAAQGEPYAQQNLGYQYATGQGTTQNETQAFAWFLKAALQGLAGSATLVAERYEQGRGVAVDPVRAARWYLEAANRDAHTAQVRMARYALDATPPDNVRAWMWLSLAAAGNDADARRQRDEVAARLAPDQLTAAQDLAHDWKVTSAPVAADLSVGSAVRTGVSASGASTRPSNVVRVAPSAGRPTTPVAPDAEAFAIVSLGFRPTPALRGQPAWMVVQYTLPTPGRPIAEEWTLSCNGQSQFPPLALGFTPDRNGLRREIPLPIPVQAPAGSYVLHLRATCAGQNAEKSFTFDVR